MFPSPFGGGEANFALTERGSLSFAGPINAPLQSQCDIYCSLGKENSGQRNELSCSALYVAGKVKWAWCKDMPCPGDDELREKKF